MQQELLEKIPPFNLLTTQEKDWLIGRSQLLTYSNLDVICAREDNEFDFMLILLSGAISVFQLTQDSSPIHVRSAPTYAGEFSVFFNQPRSATVRANGLLTCLRVEGVDIRTLIAANAAFGMGFATALSEKQRVFRGYETFANLLFSKVNEGFISLRELTNAYLDLDSILHPRARELEIDFEALGYAMSRLPDRITQITSFFLTEELPAMYKYVQDKLRINAARSHKRRFLQVLSGKCLVLLRDRETDIVDITTKLCVYTVEVRKIRKRLEDSLCAEKISRWVLMSGTEEEAFEIMSSLPFKQSEIIQLETLFGDDLLPRLYDILAQHTDMVLYFEKFVLHYNTASWEQWSDNVRKSLDEILGTALTEADVDFHIISSNTHSVVNCFSNWLHTHVQEALAWGERYIPPNVLQGIEDPTDRLYAIARYWLADNPILAAERDENDRLHGIHHVKDTSFAGIDVSIIDANRLGVEIDPFLPPVEKSRRTIILNIDYAYGQQAAHIMNALLLMLRGHIASISVIGKSGSLMGKRGDVLLPSRLIMQTNNEFYPLQNNDVTADDLRTAGLKMDIHHGSVLTVLGTIMQNSQMLHFYRLFWNVIGMEMEGAFYLREALRGIMEGLLPQNIPLRFVYYASDLPLNHVAQSLAVSMAPAEGGPTVYAITRALLHKILHTSEQSNES